MFQMLLILRLATFSLFIGLCYYFFSTDGCLTFFAGSLCLISVYRAFSTTNEDSRRNKGFSKIPNSRNLPEERQPERNGHCGVLTGALLDVSGSMKELLSLDRTVEDQVERTHAIISTLNKIVKKELHEHERFDCVFVSAFGLKDVNTCDLIQLLEYQEKLIGDNTLRDHHDNHELKRVFEKDPFYRFMNGHEVLIKFAKEKDAPHAERWIQKALKQEEAGVLYMILSRNEKLTKKFIEKLPNPYLTKTVTVSSYVSRGSLDVSVSTIQESEAYKLAMDVIHHFANISLFLFRSEAQIPQIRPITEVSHLLDRILKRIDTSDLPHECSQTGLLHFIQNNFLLKYINYILSQSGISKLTSVFTGTPQKKQNIYTVSNIKDLFDQLTPYIFGLTPMVESLKHAANIFKNQGKTIEKILFILSDGHPDEDPLPLALELQTMGVTIVTCFLTNDKIHNSKQLMDSKSFNFEENEGAKKLFEMSSSMHNTERPVSYFVDAGWKLPPSGESKLYLQANTLDLVNEFCDIIFSHEKKNTCVDALVDIIAHVSVAEYINIANSKFEAKDQYGKTCYANAIAAVYHLAMHRIVDRQGGIPNFEDILRDVTIFGKGEEGNTKFVIEKTCYKYRLRFVEICKDCAREAINERRPVIAKFTLSRKQNKEFSNYFMNNPKGVLRSADLTGLFYSAIVYAIYT